jgi:hypothetical protein
VPPPLPLLINDTSISSAAEAAAACRCRYDGSIRSDDDADFVDIPMLMPQPPTGSMVCYIIMQQRSRCVAEFRHGVLAL